MHKMPNIYMLDIWFNSSRLVILVTGYADGLQLNKLLGQISQAYRVKSNWRTVAIWRPVHSCCNFILEKRTVHMKVKTKFKWSKSKIQAESNKRAQSIRQHTGNSTKMKVQRTDVNTLGRAFQQECPSNVQNKTRDKQQTFEIKQEINCILSLTAQIKPVSQSPSVLIAVDTLTTHCVACILKSPLCPLQGGPAKSNHLHRLH